MLQNLSLTWNGSCLIHATKVCDFTATKLNILFYSANFKEYNFSCGCVNTAFYTGEAFFGSFWAKYMNMSWFFGHFWANI